MVASQPAGRPAKRQYESVCCGSGPAARATALFLTNCDAVAQLARAETRRGIFGMKRLYRNAILGFHSALHDNGVNHEQICHFDGGTAVFATGAGGGKVGKGTCAARALFAVKSLFNFGIQIKRFAETISALCKLVPWRWRNWSRAARGSV